MSCNPRPDFESHKLPSFSEELCLVPKSVWRRERERLSQETAYNLAWGALVCVWNQSCEMRLESRNQMEMESN